VWVVYSGEVIIIIIIIIIFIYCNWVVTRWQWFFFNLNYFLSFLFPSSYNSTNTTHPNTVKKCTENKYIIRSLQPGDGIRLNSLQMSKFRQKTKLTDG